MMPARLKLGELTSWTLNVTVEVMKIFYQHNLFFRISHATLPDGMVCLMVNNL